MPTSLALIFLAGLAMAAVGFALACFFETAYAHKHLIRNSMKVIIFVLVGVAVDIRYTLQA